MRNMGTADPMNVVVDDPISMITHVVVIGRRAGAGCPGAASHIWATVRDKTPNA